MAIVYFQLGYDEAPLCSGLLMLSHRHDIACEKLVSKFRASGFLNNLVPELSTSNHEYTLRSGVGSSIPTTAKTERLNKVYYKKGEYTNLSIYQKQP